MEVVCFDCEKKNLELISDLDPDIQDPVVGDARRVSFVAIYRIFMFLAQTNIGKLTEVGGNESIENSPLPAMQSSLVPKEK